MKKLKKPTIKLDKWFWLDQFVDGLMVLMIFLAFTERISKWVVIPSLIVWVILYKIILKCRGEK